MSREIVPIPPQGLTPAGLQKLPALFTDPGENAPLPPIGWSWVTAQQASKTFFVII
jgi:hypothetical protein